MTGNDLPAGAGSDLADGAYEAVRSYLLSARLEPRDRVGIDSVARELAVSATPVREAMARLCAEGLLTRRHLAGYVAPDRLTADELSKLLEFCIRLEAWTAELAARAPAPDRRKLVEHVEGGVAQIASDDSLEQSLTAHETDFHLAVATLAGNQFAESALAKTHVYFHAYRSADAIPTAAADAVLQEHRAIAAAIEAGKPERGAALMEQHIAAVAHRLRRSQF